MLAPIRQICLGAPIDRCFLCTQEDSCCRSLKHALAFVQTMPTILLKMVITYLPTSVGGVIKIRRKVGLILDRSNPAVVSRGPPASGRKSLRVSSTNSLLISETSLSSATKVARREGGSINGRRCLWKLCSLILLNIFRQIDGRNTYIIALHKVRRRREQVGSPLPGATNI